ncbi:MAG: class I SAM-dependent methyltransferase [Bacteroidia bacterium]
MFIANLAFYKKLSRKRSIAIAESISKLIDNPDSNILDFGAGNMYLAERLSEMVPGLKITGIDVIEDQNFDKTILKEFPNIFFQKYDGDKIPFNDGTFDHAIASAVMHHTPDPEYFLSELKRIVKPGGSILLVEEMYHNPIDRFFVSLEDLVFNKMKKGVPIPLNFRSYKQYKKEFEKQGLKISFEGFVRPSFPWKHHYVFKLLK